MRGVRNILLSGVMACAACSGKIDGPREIPRSAIIGAPATSSPSVADPQMRAEDPALFDLSTQYFPGTTASGGKKRLFRLTRDQLDLTTRTLLPGSYAASVSSVVPSDPLQTNYEYGDILSWNASNFTPYTGWVGEIARRVEVDPGLRDHLRERYRHHVPSARRRATGAACVPQRREHRAARALFELLHGERCRQRRAGRNRRPGRPRC